MTLLVVLGAEGQVGRALCVHAAALGLRVRGLGRERADIRDGAAVGRAVAGAGFVVNCAAYTAVDCAESEPDSARALNAAAPGSIAAACRRHGVPLLHLSTDYVFDGSGKRPWHEDDAPAPLSVYGATKAAGEQAVRMTLERHLIMRTSWVFSAHGQNFVKTILRLARSPAALRVVDDQRGGPTPADGIAAAIVTMIRAATAPGFDAWGTYHFSGAPAVSWFEFAGAILAGRTAPGIMPIPSSAYRTAARRPLNSVLDCGKIRAVFGINQPDWRGALAEMVAELDTLLPAGPAP